MFKKHNRPVIQPAMNLDTASSLQPASDDKTSDPSEPETEDSDEEWMETSEQTVKFLRRNT